MTVDVRSQRPTSAQAGASDDTGSVRPPAQPKAVTSGADSGRRPATDFEGYGPTSSLSEALLWHAYGLDRKARP